MKKFYAIILTLLFSLAISQSFNVSELLLAKELNFLQFEKLMKNRNFKFHSTGKEKGFSSVIFFNEDNSEFLKFYIVENSKNTVKSHISIFFTDENKFNNLQNQIETLGFEFDDRDMYAENNGILTFYKKGNEVATLSKIRAENKTYYTVTLDRIGKEKNSGSTQLDCSSKEFQEIGTFNKKRVQILLEDITNNNPKLKSSVIFLKHIDNFGNFSLEKILVFCTSNFFTSYGVTKYSKNGIVLSSTDKVSTVKNNLPNTLGFEIINKSCNCN